MVAKPLILTIKERSAAMGEAINKDSSLMYPTQNKREAVILKAQNEMSFKAGIEEGRQMKRERIKALTNTIEAGMAPEDTWFATGRCVLDALKEGIVRMV